MGHRRIQRGDKEYDEVQQLKHENKKLKRQNARLRKLLDRIDLNRLDELKEEEEVAKERDEVWRCFDCGKGTLRMKTIELRDGMRYYRECDVCEKRTKMQRLTKDVKK